MQEQLYTKGVVKIGIVAYAPKVVTIWEGIKDYLRGQGFTAKLILSSADWVPGRMEGYQELEEAVRKLGMLA